MFAALRNTLIGIAAVAAGPSLALAQDFTPTRFSVEVVGEGPDVILVPGLGSSRDAWAGEVERLRSSHRLHLIQLAGFAGSPAGAAAEGAVIAPAVEELHRYIAANSLGRPALIGHSMGGLMALMLARAHPEAVSRVMVVDALPFLGTLFDPNATVETTAPFAAGLQARLIGLSDADFAREQEAGVARLVRTPERRAEIIGWTLRSDRAVFARAMAEAMTTDLRPDLAAIRTPLTIVYAHDPVMGPQAMLDGLYQGAYAAAPNKTFVRIDGAYHFLMLDQPAAFDAAVRAFLG